MLVPISWLKDFVEIKLPLKELMSRLTEIGLTCESFHKEGKEIVLDVEVTPNRPDWLSILGIAREIAAIEKVKIKYPRLHPQISNLTNSLPIELIADFKLFERWTAVVLSGVVIKPSPKFIQERLKMVGLRPINNVIDITNYVMFEMGIPMHAFDYDEIKGKTMLVSLAKGGEEFTSVDGISYKLPKDAIIIRDKERIIDLAGIKGGLNSGITSATKKVLLHVTIDNPILVRKTSQALSLRSEASAIYERGPDKGGCVASILRACELIEKHAKANIASGLIDLKRKPFNSWNLRLTLVHLEKVLGIKIENGQVMDILKSLGLNPKEANGYIECLIPTYRSDLKIEEDLIEEVARIYGYNKFPRTLPSSSTNTTKIPYYFDDSFQKSLKNFLVQTGFTEVSTYSLISEKLVNDTNLEIKKSIKILNPVSDEYEFLRNSLVPSLILSDKLNRGEDVLSIFEINKVYAKENKEFREKYSLAGLTRNSNFRKLKGVLDYIFEKTGIKNLDVIFQNNLDASFWHPFKSAKIILDNETLGFAGEINPEILGRLSIKDSYLGFEIDVGLLEKNRQSKIFKEIPKYPFHIEDITFVLPERTKIGEVINEILISDKMVKSADLISVFDNSYTFRIYYQDVRKTLKDKEIEGIRNKLISIIKNKFGGIVK